MCKYWAFQLLSHHACSRDEMWSTCSVCVVTHCAHLYMLFEWVYCSHTQSVDRRFFSRQPKLVLTQRKKSQIARPWRMLRIPTARLPIGLVPRWWRWRSCLARDPDEVVCRFLRDSLWNLQPFELLFFSLSNLLTARDGSVVLLSLCQVVCILFSLEQCQVVDWVVAEVFCLAWECNASIFEFSLLLLRRRHDSPVQFDRIALCSVFFPPDFWQRVSVRFAGVPTRKYRWVVSLLFLTCLFRASVSLCSAFFVFQRAFFELLFRCVVHSLSFRRSVFGTTTAALLDNKARDWGDVAVVLRELCWSLRRLHISFTAAMNYPDFPVGIAVKTLLFVGIFAQFEDLCVVHVSEEILRFFAELVDLLRLAQVLIQVTIAKHSRTSSWILQ